jgi:hypothetical protein
MTRPTLKPKADYKIPIALDSGAFSIYHQQIAPKRRKGKRTVGAKASKHSNFSYTDTTEFKDYLELYMEFLHDLGHYFDFYALLDVIYSPEKTWEVYQIMRKEGLNPVPVYHYGSDISWLHKYMDETDYIAVGGLGRSMTKKKFLPFGDQMFKELTQSRGRWRVHGFAVASFDLLRRYPWYSIDSTTARTWANFGQLMIPHKGRNGVPYNFFTNPMSLAISDRRSTANRHLGKLGTRGQEWSRHYLTEELRFDLKDVETDHWTRAIVNYYFMSWNIDALIEWRRKEDPTYNLIYYASGISEGGVWRTINESFNALRDRGATRHLGYLGTFFEGGRDLTLRLLETQHESEGTT